MSPPTRVTGVRGAGGSVALEAVAVLPVVMLLLVAVLQVLGVVRAVLLVQEAARAGVRVAATGADPATVTDAARAAAGELPVAVVVEDPDPAPGTLIVVRVTATARLGPLDRRVTAAAVAPREPGGEQP